MILLCVLILLALCGPAHGACGDTCGLRPMGSTLGSTRVVGGSDVLPGTGAWAGIASVRCYWNPPVSIHVCGGTLISSQWLLTAAHCFINRTNDLSEWAIVLGATSLAETGPNVEVRRIKRLIMHEDYVPRLEFHDMALVELDMPVRCRSNIQTACLPAPSVKLSNMNNCYVAGWGDRIVKSSGRDILQQAKVHYISNQLCNSSEWLSGHINDFNVCAGQGGVGTCQGDSGGPLVCEDKRIGAFWQIGVTSWGIGCARPKRPSVFGSTQYYYNWIWKMSGRKPVTPAIPAAPAPTYTAAPPVAVTEPAQPCPFPREKLKQFFIMLKDILQYLKGKLF
ncbi:acrosin-like [Zonotrichia leucophrys gambelii]|uniref:acrosin-like n=1 Tax=Zonotrichia leucophrys gambelii TaxID=257770 RepID=UPI00314012F2